MISLYQNSSIMLPLNVATLKRNLDTILMMSSSYNQLKPFVTNFLMAYY